MKTLAIGGVVYTAMCYEHGGMIDDGTVFRLGKDNFRWIGGNDYGGEWIREQAEKLGLKVLVRSSTDQCTTLLCKDPRAGIYCVKLRGLRPITLNLINWGGSGLRPRV